ncbi:MAG: hypothetical protein AB1796_04660 [Bacillota bacterium]
MAYQIVVIGGKEYVRIPTKYITIGGRRVYASEFNKECLFINIPIEKFNPSRYKG